MDEDIKLDGDVSIPPQQALIRAYGLYWVRDAVNWEEQKPKLHGVRMKSKRTDLVVSEKKVNAWHQQGVYALYSSGKLMYVGLALGTNGIGERLYSHHTKPRLSGRWDSFSWFAFNGFDSNGKKHDDRTSPKSRISSDLQTIVRTMELAVILTSDPAMNRASGKFSGAERINQDPDYMIKQPTNAEIMACLVALRETQGSVKKARS
jgi:hypothetical protein